MAKKGKWALDLPPEIHQMSSAEALPLIAKAAKGRVLVQFSGGKDSVGAVERLREYFGDIRLVFSEFVPNLRITAETIDYYERRWQCKIGRMMHPAMHWQLSESAYQLPNTARAVEWWMPDPSAALERNARLYKWSMGWGDDVPIAIGLKAADSLFRRIRLKKTGPYNAGSNHVHPVYDLSNDELYELIRSRGTRLAVDYHLFYRSFDGIDYRFLAPLKEHYPDDFERIRLWYPLVGAQLKRYDYAEARKQQGRAAFRL